MVNDNLHNVIFGCKTGDDGYVVVDVVMILGKFE
jgi:hypothetical protein